jgi:fructokinase
MKKITSIGEILFDVYPNFKKVGGAPFNFIYHVAKITGGGNFVSRIGKDKKGSEILSILKSKNISSKYIQIDEIHETGEAVPTLNDSKTPDWEIKTSRAYDFIESTFGLQNLIKNNTDCLYFGTLAQRERKSRETIQSLFSNKVKFFCDLNIRQKFYTKEVLEISLKTADVLKLNEDELKLVNEIFLPDKYDFSKTAKSIKDKFKIDMLCVTLGEKGSYIFRDEFKDHYEIEIKKDEIVDTVGAGDAFASVLCIGYLMNINIEKINKACSYFASEIVKVDGALPEDDSVYEAVKKMIFDESK